MTLHAPMYQVDSFATRLFEGNPAAVVVLGDEFWDDATMQRVAAENNLAETAFLVTAGSQRRLRWFTPTVEVPLCGHATLATGAVVLDRLEPQLDEVVFDSASGPLAVARSGDGYSMDLPAREATRPRRPTGSRTPWANVQTPFCRTSTTTWRCSTPPRRSAVSHLT